MLMTKLMQYTHTHTHTYIYIYIYVCVCIADILLIFCSVFTLCISYPYKKMFIFVLRISNTAILNIFWHHSTILCLILLSCVSFSHIVCHTAIYASFCYFVSRSAVLYLIPLSRISCHYLVSHCVILCFVRISNLSFSYLVFH